MSKDLFSKQSADYARYRPQYPEALFVHLASLTPGHDRVWDVGCGNGQSAQMIAPFYKHVIATDLSEKQLAQATPRSNIEYQLGRAEDSGLPENCLDLITAAQSFHWFDSVRFSQEVKRTLKPHGVLALWSYGLAQITPEIDAITDELYSSVLNGYWEPERKLVEQGYRSVQLPLRELASPTFQMNRMWSLEHWLGYLETWSAVHAYLKVTGVNPVDALRTRFESAWPLGQPLEVNWKLSLRTFVL